MKNLTKIRKERGLSQHELSIKSGVHLTSIYLYEQGKRDINKAQADTIFKLATALNVNMEELIEKESI